MKKIDKNFLEREIKLGKKLIGKTELRVEKIMIIAFLVLFVIVLAIIGSGRTIIIDKKGITLIETAVLNEAKLDLYGGLPEAYIKKELVDAKVEKVVDGDTFLLDINGGKFKARLIGVDTPESVHPDPSRNTPFGKEVSNYSKSRLEGKNVKVRKDVSLHDKYGRLLVYLYIDGKMYNEELLEKGYANLKTIVPDVEFADHFAKIKMEKDKKNGKK